MNGLKIFLGCLLVFVLISGSVVIAQEGDAQREDDVFILDDSLDVEHPPTAADDLLDNTPVENYMVIKDKEGNITYLPVTPSPVNRTAPSPDAVPQAPEMRAASIILPSDERHIRVPEPNLGNETRAVEPITGLIPIATEAAPVWEYHPAVAHGGGFYMVAYVKDTKIFAAVLNEGGILLNTYLVEGSGWNNFPTIAYHAPSGLFLVAYVKWNAPIYNMWFTAVSPTAGHVGVWYGIDPSLDLRYPNVACNQDHQSCLLAFEYPDGSIQGQYITIDAAGVQSASSRWHLTNLNGKKPLLAWGKHAGEYLLTYTWTNSLDVQFPVFNHIQGAYTATVPYTHGATYLIDFSHWSNDKYPTGVAYDPCTEKFVVLFDHIYKTDPTDFVVDIWAAAIHKTAPSLYWYNDVAYRWGEERGGGISFITADDLPAVCGVMDKLIYTYTYHGREEIYATDLRGNNNPLATHYRREGDSKHRIVAEFNYPGVHPYWHPTVAGGSTRAKALVVFNAEYLWPEWENNYDVWGAIVKAPAKYFLPIMVR